MKYIRRFLAIELFSLCTKLDRKTHHDMMIDYAEKYINSIGGIFVGDKSLKLFSEENEKIANLIKNV